MNSAMKLGARIVAGALIGICSLALSTPARAEVTVNPKVINFGTQTVGDRSATTSVLLTNTGWRYARIDSASMSGSAFSYSGPRSFTLRPHQSLTVSVSFRPDAAHSFAGTLTFSGSRERITVSLSGTGIAPRTQDTQTTESTSRWSRNRRGRHSWNGGSTGSDPAPQPAPEPAPAPVQAPAISSQPVSRTVTAGQTAAFSVSASGTAPFSYQWKKNGSAISGANSASYSTAATTMSDNGAQFTCTVSNSAGNVTSSAALLTVSAVTVAPAISSQPVSRTVTAGQTAAFSVSVSGTAPFSYQWMKNGSAIGGAVSSTYTTPAATAADNGAQFTVLVSNAAGQITSNPATLTVSAATLSLSANPSSLSFGAIDLGSTAQQQITLTNAGNGNLTLSGLSLSGAGFSASGFSSGQVLTPGQKLTVTIRFQPAAAGSVSGQATVSSNAAPVLISLSGSGLQQVSHSVALSWTRSTSTVSGYLVYSAQASGGPYKRLTASALSLPSYTDSSVQNGQTYYYVVTAVDASGTESAYSNQASAIVR